MENDKRLMRPLLRQGDLLFVDLGPVEGPAPTGCDGRKVLRKSEATGHCHVLDGPATIDSFVGDDFEWEKAMTTLYGDTVVAHVDAHGRLAEHEPRTLGARRCMIVVESDVAADGRTRPSPD